MYAIGRKALQDILKLNKNFVEQVHLSAKLDPELSYLLEGVKFNNSTVEQLNKLSQGANHQGFVAKLRQPKSYSLKEIISDSKKARGILLAIDQVQDPHNLGAILRVADAMGVDGVIKTDRHCADEKSATVAKTSCGANYLVPITSVSNLANSIIALKKEGFWIIGSSLSQGSIEISKLDACPPVVLILGAEGKGMRRQTEELCDYLVNIPMKGSLQSLNVSTAASILLYEINRLVLKNGQ